MIYRTPPNFDHELFVRLYNEFINSPTKLEVYSYDNSHDVEGHEWIDIDEVILNNQKIKKQVE